MTRWSRGRHAIEMIDEATYSFGSTDNARSYLTQLLFESNHHPSSIHGVRCVFRGEHCGSTVVGAGGGGTGVNEHSCVLLADRCLIAVGDRIVALALPNLDLLWQASADTCTCFGLHATSDEQHIVVHGELEISKFTVDGRKEWAFFGKDIFTGEFALRSDSVVVSDFNHEQYVVDLHTGRGEIVRAA